MTSPCEKSRVGADSLFSRFRGKLGGMTEGEIIFHLREIIAAWAPPRITATTAANLERLNLIEFSDERRLVRLTPEGVQRKLASRTSTEDRTITSIQRRPLRRQRNRPFGVRKLA